MQFNVDRLHTAVLFACAACPHACSVKRCCDQPVTSTMFKLSSLRLRTTHCGCTTCYQLPAGGLPMGFSETQGRQPTAASAAITERKPNEKLSVESQCISGITSSRMQTIVDLPWLLVFPAPKHNRSLFACTCRLCLNALANPKLNASGFAVVVKLVPRGLEPRTLR